MVKILCKRCGTDIPSYNKLRKWCVDCRRALTNERARVRNKIKTEERRQEREKILVEV